MSADEETVDRVARAIWTVRDKRFPDRVRRPEPDKLDMASGAWQMVMEDARAAIAAMPGRPDREMVVSAIRDGFAKKHLTASFEVVQALADAILALPAPPVTK
jgi:hypothetical protein